MRARYRWWELLLAPLALVGLQAPLRAAEPQTSCPQPTLPAPGPAPMLTPPPPPKPGRHRPPASPAEPTPFLHALERCDRDPTRALDVRAGRLFERIGPTVLRKVLIVTVPDPVDSSFGEGFDATLSAVGAALAAAGYASGEYSLPWLDQANAPTDKRSGESDDAPSSRCVPGILVFRRGASSIGDKRSDVVLVLLVGETPAWGVHVNALGQALTFAKKSGATDRVPILGPAFSGSAASLRAALDEWAKAQDPRDGPPPVFQIVSGGATAPAIADELRGPGIQFSATVVPDNVQTCAMYRFLAKRLGIAMNGVALFVESNTAFGDFFKRFQCPPEPDVPGPPLRPRIIVPFPLHIAELRAAEEKQRKASDGKSQVLAAAPLGGDSLDLRIDQGRQSMDNLPAFAPDLTAPGTQLELTEILGTLCRQQIRAVGLLASDVRDVAVLGEEALRRCPGLTLFTLGPDRILHHQRYRDLDGLLVASSYPLHASAASWSYPFRGREILQTFPSEGSEGVYNATLLLLDEPSKVVDYGPPPGVDKCEAIRPPVWISSVGRDGFWPITASAYGLGDNDFVRSLPRTADAETVARQHRTWARRFSLPAGFVFLMALVQLFSCINLIGFVVQSNPSAPPSRRRSMWGWLDPYRAVGTTHAQPRRLAAACALWVLLLMNLGVLILYGIPMMLGSSWRMGIGGHVSALICGGLATAIIMLALGPVPAWDPPGGETPGDRGHVDRTFLAALLAGAVIIGQLLLAVLRPWLQGLATHEPDLTFFYERTTNVTSGVSAATGGLLYALALLAACIAELNRLRLNAFAAEFRYACFDLWDDDGPGCKLTAAVSTGPLAVVVVTTFTAAGIATAYGDYHHPFEGAWLGYLFCLLGPFVIGGMILFQLHRFARVWVIMHRVLRGFTERRSVPDFKEIFAPHFLHMLQPPLDPTLGHVLIDQVVEERRATKRSDEAPLRLLLFASYGRAHLHNLLTFVSVSGLLLILLSTTYPFKLLHGVDILTWVMAGLILAVALFVLIEMNRDEVLSVIGGTTPGRVSLDRSFTRTVLIHVGLPLLGLAATRFTTVGVLVGDFVRPLLQLFSI
jgi:hypothetical protein